ncbi:ficolin-1-like [Musca domestica]|uniref:Ficolin-1-like n=1 Tax=Musca domestica TaxID=7370 RepID=A0ABM3VHI2_MUSDO|nr:ficolin-1-like [Musca domestica]
MDALHNLTSDGLQHEIVITLKDFDNVQTYARYDNIVIGSEDEQYTLKTLGVYSGNAEDALRHNVDENFTTLDRDNDKHLMNNCAQIFSGPWWYFQCNPGSQLFGPYNSERYNKRIRWSLEKDNNVKFVEVKMKHTGPKIM